nr:MAG TPA: hypothetical protein [Caudoviricetes sp.]
MGFPLTTNKCHEITFFFKKFRNRYVKGSSDLPEGRYCCIPVDCF